MLSILVSNDDGVYAPGLAALADALAPLGSVTVIAPDRNCSGASNSLTLETPIRVNRLANGFYSVRGTPTDCVHLAVTGFLDTAPDLVVSGINRGANLGDDVLYSGTVAAAMEGRFLGRPAIAISITAAQPAHYDTAARFARMLVARLENLELPRDTLLNVNVPDRAWSALAGVRATRLGSRHRAEPTVRVTDPKGLPVYWIGEPGGAADAGEGSDFAAIGAGAISITPLTVDLTHHPSLQRLSQWLQELS